MSVQDDPRDQQPANGIQLLTWVLSDDRRTSRAIRLVLATAVWTAPPAVVIGVLIGLSGAGASLLISIAALVTMTVTIFVAVWMLRYQLRGEGRGGFRALLRTLTRRFRRGPGSTGTGRHALPNQWPNPPTAQWPGQWTTTGTGMRPVPAPPPMGNRPMTQAG